MTGRLRPDLSLLPPSAELDGNDLRIGGCSLRDLAAEFGTPAFVIDEQALRDRAAAYAGIAGRHPRSRVCFAMKSFPSASMVSVLIEEGLGWMWSAAASCGSRWPPGPTRPGS